MLQNEVFDVLESVGSSPLVRRGSQRNIDCDTRQIEFRVVVDAFEIENVETAAPIDEVIAFPGAEHFPENCVFAPPQFIVPEAAKNPFDIGERAGRRRQYDGRLSSIGPDPVDTVSPQLQVHMQIGGSREICDARRGARKFRVVVPLDQKAVEPSLAVDRICAGGEPEPILACIARERVIVVGAQVGVTEWGWRNELVETVCTR